MQTQCPMFWSFIMFFSSPQHVCVCVGIESATRRKKKWKKKNDKRVKEELSSDPQTRRLSEGKNRREKNKKRTDKTRTK